MEQLWDSKRRPWTLKVGQSAFRHYRGRWYQFALRDNICLVFDLTERRQVASGPSIPRAMVALTGSWANRACFERALPADAGVKPMEVNNG